MKNGALGIFARSARRLARPPSALGHAPRLRLKSDENIIPICFPSPTIPVRNPPSFPATLIHRERADERRHFMDGSGRLDVRIHAQLTILLFFIFFIFLFFIITCFNHNILASNRLTVIFDVFNLRH